MRILYHHRTMADGAEGIHIREIVLALRALGHDVEVVALAGDPTQPGTPTASRAGAYRRLIPGFAYEIAEIGYNVVGTRQILAAARRFKPDVIYDRYNSYSTAALRAARQAKLPMLLEVNAPVAYERTVEEHLRLKMPWLARRYERRIFERADRIIAVSTPLKRFLVETLRIDPAKIVVLPNGVDPDAFVPSSGDAVRQQYSLIGRTVVGFVGILRPWHGVDMLLETFRDVRQTCGSAHLLIVGDGPMQAQLEARSRALGIGDAVTFTGRVPHAAVGGYVAAMDIAISPRATFYASPMKIPEYMAMAKCVLAQASDNIRDLIVHGESGWLFETDSQASMAEALRRVIDDEGLRRTLGQSARARTLQHLNWRNSARRIIDEAAALRAGGAAAYSNR